MDDSVSDHVILKPAIQKERAISHANFWFDSFTSFYISAISFFYFLGSLYFSMH